MGLKDFTRERILTFPRLILFFINLAKKSLQVNLNEFFKFMHLPSVTKQALNKARKKLSPETFVLLNDKLIEEYYTDNEFSTWKGYRLIGVDRSDIQLPQTQEIKELYGTAKNQLGPALGMARISQAYDLLNHLTLSTKIDCYNTSERDLFVEQIETIKDFNTNDLFILDRGYPSYGILFYLTQQKKDFLIRCTISNCISKIKTVFSSGQEDAIIRLYAKDIKKTVQVAEMQKRVPAIDRKKGYLDLRVIVLTLKTGEKELLITSLLDEKKYSKEEFESLYFRRWGIEENYKWHKQVLELENFSGHSQLAIEQDIFSLIFTANMTTLLMNEAQEEIEKEHENKGLKYTYKVNKRIAIASLRDELVANLLNRHINMNEFCERLKVEFKRSLCPTRLGRSYKRPKKGRLKFRSTYRSCI